MDMVLSIIPNDLSSLTPGERRVLEKLKMMYKEVDRHVYVYIQPRLRYLEPDFILIDNQKGVCIIEVKDWEIDYIDKIDRRNVLLKNNRTVENPLFKANMYYNSAKGLFNMQQNLIDDEGELKFTIHSTVIFTNLTEQDIEDNQLITLFTQPPSTYIPSNRIASLTIEQLFKGNNDVHCLQEEDIHAIRTVLFPEIKIIKVTKNKHANGETIQQLIKALDAEQEKYAKRLPYGHYMITGVPGSGKTVLLLARAVHLIRENPQWKIRILTYNKSLQIKIQNQLNAIAVDLRFFDIPIENIIVTTFHKFAIERSGMMPPSFPSDEWWQDTLPQAALSNEMREYDAILIDEYQDFFEDWIKVCINACVEHEYMNNQKMKTKGINLFLAGDRLQSIYNTREQSWKSIGIDMRGRSEFLKRAYRSGSEHIHLALTFLKQDKKLAEEVDKFYDSEKDLSFENEVHDSVTFIEGDYTEVVNIIHNLIYKIGYEPADILVLCRQKNSCGRLKRLLNPILQQKVEIGRDITEGKMIMTTYYSSKGLEAPIVILVDVDKFVAQSIIQADIKERKLLYVGMTRASEQLYIHATSFDNDSFAKILKKLKG
ncbi:MAG: UvrD-helicase domain-containing protein [Bacillaceae bacterium]